MCLIGHTIFCSQDIFYSNRFADFGNSIHANMSYPPVNIIYDVAA